MPYRPLPPASLPPRDQIAGVLLLLTEDQTAPERWLARAHVAEPSGGDRQDVYLVALEDAVDRQGYADRTAGPVIIPELGQLLVALRERDAYPRGRRGPAVLRPAPIAVAAIAKDREADIVGCCLEVERHPTCVALECVGVEGHLGAWRLIETDVPTAARAQVLAPFIERVDPL